MRGTGYREHDIDRSRLYAIISRTYPDSHTLQYLDAQADVHAALRKSCPLARSQPR